MRTNRDDINAIDRIYQHAPPAVTATGTLVLTRAGSVTHGTYVPPDDPDSIDDVDFAGAVFPPSQFVLGLDQFETWHERWEEMDVTVHSVFKTFRLLLKSNPNILTLLWMPPQHILVDSREYETLVANREIFISKQIYQHFIGYAHGQLKKMTAGQHLGYMGQKRAELVSRFGYDTKNASHGIRILKQGIEFLADGYLRVDRSGFDAEELIAIKRGDWELATIKRYADDLFEDAKQMLLASPLPEKPDRARINELLVEFSQGRLCS